MRGASWAPGLVEEELVKYRASATHQEILAGLAKEPSERKHVFAFFLISQGPEEPELVKLKQVLIDEYSKNRLPDGNIQEFEARRCRSTVPASQSELKTPHRSGGCRFQSQPALKQEQDAHQLFAQDRPAALLVGVQWARQSRTISMATTRGHWCFTGLLDRVSPRSSQGFGGLWRNPAHYRHDAGSIQSSSIS